MATPEMVERVNARRLPLPYWMSLSIMAVVFRILDWLSGHTTSQLGLLVGVLIVTGFHFDALLRALRTPNGDRNE